MDRKDGILSLRPFKRTRDSEDSTNKRPRTKTTITVNSPCEGNRLQGGDKMRVTWTCQGHVSNVDIRLRKGNRVCWLTSLADGVANEGTYSVMVPKGLLPSSDYYVEVLSALDSDVKGRSATFCIDRDCAPPSITVNSPCEGNRLQGADAMGLQHESNKPTDSCADVEFVGEKSFDEVQEEKLERAKRNGYFLDLDADENASFESKKCIINLMNADDDESHQNFDSATAAILSQQGTRPRQRCLAPFVPPQAL